MFPTVPRHPGAPPQVSRELSVLELFLPTSMLFNDVFSCSCLFKQNLLTTNSSVTFGFVFWRFVLKA